MFSMFIVFLAIVTIVLYLFQKNLKKSPSAEGRYEEQTVSPDIGNGQQTNSQDEPPIPSTITPQNLPLPEQQAAISAVQHPITHTTETQQGETPPHSTAVPEDSSGTAPKKKHRPIEN